MKYAFTAACAVMFSLSGALAQDAATIAQRKAEQAMPRSEVAVDAAKLDRYAGNYQLSPGAVLNLRRVDDHLEARRNGQTLSQLFAESDSKFFFKTIHAQISFAPDAKGQIGELVLHQNGNEKHAPRIDETAAYEQQKRINSAKVYRGSIGFGSDGAMPMGLTGLNSR